MSTPEIKLLPTPVAGDGRKEGCSPSDLSSPVPGCSTSDYTSPASGTDGCARPTLTAETSCEPGSGCRCTTTSEPSEVKLLPTPNASLSNYGDEPEDWEVRRAAAAAKHGNNGLGAPLPIAIKMLLSSESTSSPGGSPARAPAAPATAPDSNTPRLFCGAKCGASLASYIPGTSSSRTWPTSSQSAGGSRMTDAYAAGLIDGEGCIYIGKADLRPRVEVAMTKAEALLTGLQAEYGGRVRLQKTDASRADLHRWVAYGRTAHELLLRVGPHLRLKEEQAKLLLDACEIYEGLRPRADDSRHWTQAAREQIDALRRRIVELNRRGPMVTPVLPADGRFVKPQSSLLEPFGELFSGTWPRSGSMCAGTVFPLVPSAPRTSVTACLPLLSTPTARDGREDGSQNVPSANGSGTSLMKSLLPLLPTPRSSLRHSREATIEEGLTRGESLPSAVAKLLPTPTARDWRDGAASQATFDRNNGRPLNERIHRMASPSTGASTDQPSNGGKPSTGLRLNPSFVGWMMGTPLCGECGREWTDPDCQHAVTEFTST